MAPLARGHFLRLGFVFVTVFAAIVEVHEYAASSQIFAKSHFNSPSRQGVILVKPDKVGKDL